MIHAEHLHCKLLHIGQALSFHLSFFHTFVALTDSFSTIARCEWFKRRNLRQ